MHSGWVFIYYQRKWLRNCHPAGRWQGNAVSEHDIAGLRCRHTMMFRFLLCRIKVMEHLLVNSIWVRLRISGAYNYTEIILFNSQLVNLQFLSDKNRCRLAERQSQFLWKVNQVPKHNHGCTWFQAASRIEGMFYVLYPSFYFFCTCVTRLRGKRGKVSDR